MMNELKPCPFCGGDAKISSSISANDEDWFWVTCRWCDVETDAYSVKEKAIEAWNRRADNE